MPDAPTQKNRDLAIETPLGEDVLLLKTFSGTEQLGRPFELQCELYSVKPNIKADTIVGRNVTVRLTLSTGATRYFNGYVNAFTRMATTEGLTTYWATIVPQLWLLTRRSDCRIFQEKTVPDIIKEILKDDTYKLTDIEEALSGSYAERDYCVQYRESDFDFISRLMEQEGIYYYFKHDNGTHTLVLADSANAHKSYPEFDELKYHPSGKGTSEENCVSEWIVETRLQSGSYALQDFDYTNINKDLVARAIVKRDHAGSEYEVYDYPGKYSKAGDGEAYAKIRIQELQAQYEVATSKSDCRGLCTGYTFGLKNDPAEDKVRQYLITGAKYEIQSQDFSSSSSDSNACTFTCQFLAMDKDQPFRTASNTPKPVIFGPQTAIVVGKSGEEIFTDEYGRVKVKFHWDRYNKADENSSCWIRVAQVWAGKKWGGLYTPRVGQEVIVEFIEGDPDRPIITGRVYNAQVQPPYDPKTTKTISTLKSNSSKGGGGFNELRFDDKKDAEQIFIHAEKDQDVRIKKDSREWIGSERHLIVKKNQLEKVEGDKHTTITGDLFAQTDGDQHLTLTGDQLTKISGDHLLTIEGDQKEDVGGDQNLKASSNLNTEAGMKISIKAGTDLHEKAGASYAVDASTTVHIKGGGTVVIEGMQVSLKAGPSFVDISSDGVDISGPMVNINSGGAAGSGAGSSPTAPAAPGSPTAPTAPTEAATGKPGEVAEPPKAPKPPTPVTFSPQATTMKEAAKDGTPFCEECEKAKKEQAS